MFSNDNFNINIEMDLVKSEDVSNNEMRIGGFASTSHEDRDGDEIVQKGLDISNFVNYGFFNLDHDNTYILGYPDKAKTKVSKDGFYVEGTLLKGVPEAERLYKTAIALKKAKAPRKLGFSVEGKTLERDVFGRIVKAMVYNVAITANPVNPNATWDALVKAFTVPQMTDNKSMAAGYGFDMNTPSNGSVFIPESLESDLRNLSYVIKNPDSMRSFKEKLENSDLDDSQLILYFQVTKGLSRVDAESLVNLIKQRKGGQ